MTHMSQIQASEQYLALMEEIENCDFEYNLNELFERYDRASRFDDLPLTIVQAINEELELIESDIFVC